MDKPQKEITRRSLLEGGLRSACFLSVSGFVGFLMRRGEAQATVWQIDPYKCIACDKCASCCVLEESAVKCVQVYSMCGYCKLCTGYYEAAPMSLNTGAENQLCPTGAIRCTFVEDPYYEYTIEESLCIGCGKCVKGCKIFGNGSLFLQVRHDRCLNCNECAIAIACPTSAFQRVPADRPYLLKGTNPRA